MPRPERVDPVYVMGQSDYERERLQAQGDLFRPFTDRLFRAAGLAPGMRVLDVGCGTGDVSLLCAEIVGPSGSVTGIDRDPDALSVARRRGETAELTNVRFVQGDYRQLPTGDPFDAVVGRLVLLYAADPVAAVGSLLPHLRSGGLIVFQESDFTRPVVLPFVPTAARIAAWWDQAARRAGIEQEMGLKLYAVFRAAGLPGPDLLTDRLIGGGPDFVGYRFYANIVRSILPLLLQSGLATAEEVDIETLEDRLRAEVVAGGGVIALPMTIGAWARNP